MLWVVGVKQTDNLLFNSHIPMSDKRKQDNLFRGIPVIQTKDNVRTGVWS